MEQRDRARWRKAYAFIGRDHKVTTTTADILVPALKFELHPYQYYGVFAMLEWFVDGRNGGLLADTMGLGKVSTASLLH